MYYTYNGHGDVTALTDWNGNVTKKYEFDAFGVEKDKDDNDTNPFRYCGEYYDRETDTVYLRARYYNPGLGRFTSEDPHWNLNNMIYGDSWNKDNPIVDINAIKQSSQLYVYCINNPLNYIDYTGKWTLAIGGDLSAAFGIKIGGGGQLVIDGNGNIGILVYGSGGGGFPTIGQTYTITGTNADTIYDLAGLGGSAGASGNISLMPIPISLGGELSISSSNDNEPVYGVTAVAGAEASLIVEVHGEVVITGVIDISWIKNIVSYDNIYETIMDKVEELPEEEKSKIKKVIEK